MSTLFKTGERVKVTFNDFNHVGTIVAYLGGYSREYVVSFGHLFYIDSRKFSDNNLTLSKLVFPEHCINPLSNKVTFVYEKSLYDVTRRTVEIQEENSEYICGLDVDDNFAFKKFLKTKIVGPIKKV